MSKEISMSTAASPTVSANGTASRTTTDHCIGDANAMKLPPSRVPSRIAAALLATRGGAAVTRILVALAASCAFAALTAGSAQAQSGFGISSFTTSLSSTQAGAHPNITTTIALAVDGTVPNPDHIDNTILNLPPGFVGNPTAAPQCPQGDLMYTGCPTNTQIGLITLTFDFFGNPSPQTFPLYNLTPLAGQTAVFGVDVADAAIRLVSSVRSNSDYGVTVTSSDSSELVPVEAITTTLWGVPADPSHDAQRYTPAVYTLPIAPPPGDSNGNPIPAGIAPEPFLTNPSDCSSGPLDATVEVDDWENPAVYYSATTAWPATTGCAAMTFPQPTLSVRPAQSSAGSPSGYDVDLSVPQNQDPYALATPPLKDVSVTLPQGVTLSAPAANGLGGCTDAQLGLHSLAPATCPDSSKVGTVEIDTPYLPDAMTGSIYVGSQPAGSDPYRIFLVAQSDGVTVKLAGAVQFDPATGQLTTVFQNNPQIGFSELKLHFFGGPDAALSNPPACGTYTTNSDITPYGGVPDQFPTAQFTINSGCGVASAFSPSLSAGVLNPVAGRYTSFVMDLSRPDGQQNISGLRMVMPPGVLANLNGVPLCPAADTASGSCPAGSQVGTTTVAIGDGTDPLYLPQPGKAPTAVYLAGPYKGAPYSLVIVVPAQAGPYDLGTIAIRAALYINPTTAQVTVVSDPLPQIVMGVPNQYRHIYVNINRPDFMLAPTSCAPLQVQAQVTGVPLGGPLSVNSGDIGFSTAAGTTKTITNRFQVGGCASLKFSPRLSMKLTGKGRTRSGDHPNLVSVLTQRGGQANIHNVRVALPLSMALDPNDSQHVCSYQVAQAATTGPANCPASTLVGHATAITPLLSQPLSGPVYLVQGIRMQNGVQVHTLPSLLIPLRGQIALDLRAQTSVSHGKLVTTFPTIPDAPVSKFTLTINGGRKGILVITGRGRSICGSPQVTQAMLAGQNGKAVYPNIKMGTSCRAVHQKHGRKRKHARRRHTSRHH